MASLKEKSVTRIIFSKTRIALFSLIGIPLGFWIYHSKYPTHSFPPLWKCTYRTFYQKMKMKFSWESLRYLTLLSIRIMPSCFNMILNKNEPKLKINEYNFYSKCALGSQIDLYGKDIDALGNLGLAYITIGPTTLGSIKFDPDSSGKCNEIQNDEIKSFISASNILEVKMNLIQRQLEKLHNSSSFFQYKKALSNPIICVNIIPSFETYNFIPEYIAQEISNMASEFAEMVDIISIDLSKLDNQWILDSKLNEILQLTQEKLYCIFGIIGTLEYELNNCSQEVLNIMESSISKNIFRQAKANTRKPPLLMLKINDDLTPEQVSKINNLCCKYQINIVNIHRNKFKFSETGKKAVKVEGQLKLVRTLLHKNIKIVSSGNVVSVEDAKKRLTEGCDLIEVGEEFVDLGPYALEELIKS